MTEVSAEPGADVRTEGGVVVPVSELAREERAEAAEPAPEEREERPAAVGIVAGGAVVETLGGLGAVVLALVGLSEVLPLVLAAAGALALGGALCLEGAAIASRYGMLRAAGREEDAATRAELSVGVATEILGGATGVVLGALSLFDFAPDVLLPVAVIVFGTALLFGTATTYRFDTLGEAAGGARARQVAREALSAAAGTQVLVGLAGVSLGILALVTPPWQTLALVGFLTLGAAVVLSGTTLTTKILAMLPYPAPVETASASGGPRGRSPAARRG